LSFRKVPFLLWSSRNSTPSFVWHSVWPSVGWKPCLQTATLPRMTASREVLVYSRKGCHLCEIVKESIVKLHKRGGFTWREIDVDSDAEIRRLYTDEVPVVFINGRKAFKYRMDEQEFLRKLSA
jgi:glutaredoxin